MFYVVGFLYSQTPFHLKSIAEAGPVIHPSGADTRMWDCAAEDEVEGYLDVESCCYQLKQGGRTFLVLRNDVCNLPEGTMFAVQRLMGPNGDNPVHAGRVQETAGSN
jgi:hypothetical protein